MAVQKYHNIVGSTATVTSLVPVGSKSPPIKSIVITNTRDSATDAQISLFLQNDPDTGASSTFEMLHKVQIPQQASLLLDESSMLSFDNSAKGFGLQLQCGNSDTLDVLINF
jgi:hypothetical protein